MIIFVFMQDMEKTYNWGHTKRYNDFSSHFKKMFNERVQKVSIDAGFTCPNRDGSKGIGGCTFCNNVTFTPAYCNIENSIEQQLKVGIEFFRRKYSSMKFLAYFQSYTNTYAPLEYIKKVFETTLKNPEILGLVVATRPDCLDDNILDYLQEISVNKYVMVELGVESCENSTLDFINRCHTFEDSVSAIENLATRGLNNCVHMIAGLPGESKETILKQPVILSKLPIGNLKIHQLQIHKGTKMEEQYDETPELFGVFSTVDEYTELMADYLELLNPKIIVERFVSYTPSAFLIAPGWGLKNFEFVAKLEKLLEDRDTWQGRLFK